MSLASRSVKAHPRWSHFLEGGQTHCVCSHLASAAAASPSSARFIHSTPSTLASSKPFSKNSVAARLKDTYASDSKPSGRPLFRPASRQEFRAHGRRKEQALLLQEVRKQWVLEAKEKAGLEAVSRSRALLAKRGSMSRANLNMKRKKDREVAERLLATQLSRDLVSNPAKPEFESSASAQMVPDSTQPQSASESTAVASGTPQPARTVASQRRRDLARARAHGNAQMPKGEDAAINWGPALDGVTRPSTSDAGTNAENATSSSQEQASNGSDAGVYVPEGPPKEQTRNFSFSARAAAMNPSPAEASKDGTDGGWGTDSLRPSIKGDLGPGFVGGFGGSSAHSSRDPPPHYIRGADWGLGEDGGWGTGRGKARSRTQLFYGQQAEAERVVRERDTGRAELAASDEQQKAARLWSEDRIGKLGAEAVNVQRVEPLREMKVPPLAHGLDRVLFNPGVHWLRDARSGIYNYDPWLRHILDVDLFDYSALPPYVTSSQDDELLTLAKRHGRKFCGSTSSLTGLLSQCYFLISGWKDPDISALSSTFQDEACHFAAGAKLAASIVLRRRADGQVFAIDADKAASGEAANNNYVLTNLGKSMEKMLTASPEEFAKYHRNESHKISEEERNKREAYFYSKTNKIMMRSQLDCEDPRLPRRTFDLKTRAVVAIRQDRANYVESSGYQIRRAQGWMESFEREYYDMIRSAFLKYSFQARIGNMDGIFVAYHNTATIFGFQYISIEEMDLRLFGSSEMGDQAYRLCLGLLERILETATELFPDETLRITFEMRTSQDSMQVFIEPESASSSVDDAPSASTAENESSNISPSSTVETSPPPSDAASSQDQTSRPSKGPKRTIAQLDVNVDRYLDDALVKGPVDFGALPGREKDARRENELERRIRAGMPPVNWTIDYSISPRPDLSESEILSNLRQTRSRQARLSTLVEPNVDAIKEREEAIRAELTEEARRGLDRDRREGIAAGMPVLPGLVAWNAANASASASPDEQEKEKDKLGQGQLADPSPSSPSSPSTDSTSWRKPNKDQLQMRNLARQGKEDAEKAALTDRLVLYKRLER